MSRKKQKTTSSDSTYFLKMVLFLILGSQWLRIESFPDWSIPLPIGLALGLMFASHEHFRLDRRLEYVVLLIASFISFWLPMGILLEV